jgi:hypothetical protein
VVLRLTGSCFDCAALDVPRYKYIVQVVMGEQKGEGIQIGSRFFWDSDTDKFATESFSNVSVHEGLVCGVVQAEHCVSCVSF